MAARRDSGGQLCIDEEVPCVTAVDEPVSPSGTAASLKALRALAQNQRHELDNLFTLHLRQQSELFDVFASSSTRDQHNSGVTEERNESEPSRHGRFCRHQPALACRPIAPGENICAAETVAETRNLLELRPADKHSDDGAVEERHGARHGRFCRRQRQTPPSENTCVAAETMAEARNLELHEAADMPLKLPEPTVREEDDKEDTLVPLGNKKDTSVHRLPSLPSRVFSLFVQNGHSPRECSPTRSLSSATAVTYGPVSRLLHHVAFKYFISIIILVNTITLGLMTQDRVKATMADRPIEFAWEYFELAFCVIFVVELVLRLLAEQTGFFCGKDWRWNLLDSFIVIHSLIDQVGKFAPNLSFARVLRIVRFLRIMRLVKVLRGFTSFRLMVYSLLGSVKNLLWIFLCLFLLLYSFTLFFLHGVAESFSDVDAAAQEEMRLYYGSVYSCMLSLFMCVTGGDDWANRMQPFRSISSIYVYAFIFYIFFMVFGAVNVVVAAFVETAASVSRRDRDSIIEQQIEQTQHIAEDIRNFFHAADQDGSGVLERDELSRYLEDDRVKASFNSLGIDVSQAIDLFDLLDADDDGRIILSEFLSGCMRLRGAASSMDVNLLLWEVEKMTWKVSAVNHSMDRCVYWLEQLLGTSPEMQGRLSFQNPRKKQLDAWTAERKCAALFKLSSVNGTD